MHRTSTPLGLALVSLLLAACGGSSGGSALAPTAPPITTIDKPTTVDLYPNGSTENPARLTVMVTAVGSVAVSMPLAFDTGSAGITLYAPSIFPGSMLGATGFIFPSGESQMSYGGITVTNQQGTRTYGSILDKPQPERQSRLRHRDFRRCERPGHHANDAGISLLFHHG